MTITSPTSDTFPCAICIAVDRSRSPRNDHRGRALPGYLVRIPAAVQVAEVKRHMMCGQLPGEMIEAVHLRPDRRGEIERASAANFLAIKAKNVFHEQSQITARSAFHKITALRRHRVLLDESRECDRCSIIANCLTTYLRAGCGGNGRPSRGRSIMGVVAAWNSILRTAHARSREGLEQR